MGSRLSRPDVGVQYSLVSTKNKGKETGRLSIITCITVEAESIKPIYCIIQLYALLYAPDSISTLALAFDPDGRLQDLSFKQGPKFLQLWTAPKVLEDPPLRKICFNRAHR